MKRAWLDAFTWEMVIAANAALCQGKGALHRPSSDGHERARQLWERQHPQAMWLDEAVDLCRQCHRLAPFCNYNGNTFAAIARQLILEIPLEADQAHLIRSWAGHIVAGTAEAVETEQFRQFSRSLPDGKKRK